MIERSHNPADRKAFQALWQQIDEPAPPEDILSFESTYYYKELGRVLGGISLYTTNTKGFAMLANFIVDSRLDKQKRRRIATNLLKWGEEEAIQMGYKSTIGIVARPQLAARYKECGWAPIATNIVIMSKATGE